MESVEWVSFVLIIFKVVSLAAFGGVDTGNLFQLVLIQQNGRFLLKLNNCLFPSNYSNSNRHKSWIFYTLPLPLLEKYSQSIINSYREQIHNRFALFTAFPFRTII